MGATALAGKVCIVTGASSGIGLAVTKALLAEGAKVVLVARRESKLHDAVKRLKPAKGATLVVPGDVAKTAHVKQIVHQAMTAYGRVDVLVNAAGGAAFGPITETTDEMWESMLNGNLKGTFLMCRQVVPLMVKAGKGDIVNIGSIASHQGFDGSTAYTASKHGLLGFSRALAAEVRKKGIRVMTVSPGAVDTPLWDASGGGPGRERMLQAEDVAQTVLSALTLSPTATADEFLVMPREGVL